MSLLSPAADGREEMHLRVLADALHQAELADVTINDYGQSGRDVIQLFVVEEFLDAGMGVAPGC